MPVNYSRPAARMLAHALAQVAKEREWAVLVRVVRAWVLGQEWVEVWAWAEAWVWVVAWAVDNLPSRCRRRWLRASRCPRRCPLRRLREHLHREGYLLPSPREPLLGVPSTGRWGLRPTPAMVIGLLVNRCREAGPWRS